MLGDRYVVAKGDSLWRIAARQLGSGRQWPRIWKYNNRPEIIRITGRAIPNPDTIRVGQLLLIPRLPTTRVVAETGNEQVANHLPVAVEPSQLPSASFERRSVSPSVPSKTPKDLAGEARKPHLPGFFKFRLDDLAWPAQDVGAAIVEMRMTGDVLLMSKKTYPATFITSRGEVEVQMVNEANGAFAKLVSDSRVVYDPATKRVTFRSMLINQSDTPNMPASALGIEMSSNSPVPKLRAEIRLSKLELRGAIGAFQYIAMDVKVVVEITSKPKLPPPPQTMQPERQRAPVHPEPQSVDNWARVIGAGLVVTGAGIVVATIVEDFLTIGVGAVDDPASFSVAGLAVARGLVMLGVSAHALPKAPRAARIDAPVKFELSSTTY
jgi:hypothetical protein